MIIVPSEEEEEEEGGGKGREMSGREKGRWIASEIFAISENGNERRVCGRGNGGTVDLLPVLERAESVEELGETEERRVGRGGGSWGLEVVVDSIGLFD